MRPKAPTSRCHQKDDKQLNCGSVVLWWLRPLVTSHSQGSGVGPWCELSGAGTVSYRNADRTYGVPRWLPTITQPPLVLTVRLSRHGLGALHLSDALPLTALWYADLNSEAEPRGPCTAYTKLSTSFIVRVESDPMWSAQAATEAKHTSSKSQPRGHNENRGCREGRVLQAGVHTKAGCRSRVKVTNSAVLRSLLTCMICMMCIDQ